MGPEQFDFHLPPEQVAQTPAERRGRARMMVVAPGGAAPTHTHAEALPEFLPPDALVVLNETRVVPARVHLERESDGRPFELLVCEPRPGLVAGDTVEAWVRGAKRLKPGDRLRSKVPGGVVLGFVGAAPVDGRARAFELVEGDLMVTLQGQGEVPLPPYIERPNGPLDVDRERYQTVFARHDGSVAAPTAGLHFEADLLERLDTARISLHVGPGTFLPMDVEDVREHRVGAERVEIGEAAASKIAQARSAGRPIVAVGTTVTRALEGIAARHDGAVVPVKTHVDLVITPGHPWRVVDGLVTNFHLPRSSLLMLVCAFAGRETVLGAYNAAVEAGYRFYSYGDCMFSMRAPQEMP